MTFYADIHGAERMSPVDFDNPLTSHQLMDGHFLKLISPNKHTAGFFFYVEDKLT